VNRIRTGDQGRGNDIRNVEVRALRRSGPNAKSFVRVAHVQRIAVRFRINRYGTHAKFAAGTINT
jgi:hypothetical protein